MNSKVKEEDALIARAVRAAEVAHTRHNPPSKPSAWGSLLSLTGLASQTIEPTSDELLEAFMRELEPLGSEAILAAASPNDPERKRVFATALTLVAMRLVQSESGQEADELFVKCNALHASVVAAVGSVPQCMVDHAVVMVDWMTWRLDHAYLYDTALFYVVEAEYQVIDACRPSLLTRPSETTTSQAHLVLERIAALKGRLVNTCRIDQTELVSQIHANAERLAALAHMERKLEEELQK